MQASLVPFLNDSLGLSKRLLAWNRGLIRVKRTEEMAKLSRILRIGRVGLAYLVYGGLIVTTTNVAVPLLSLFGVYSGRRDLLTQLSLHHAARIARWLVGKLRIVDVRLSGVDRLRRPGPFLVLANHPTHFDATMLISIMPQVDNIAEATWINAPVMGKAIRSSGHLRNDRPRQVIEDGVRRLAERRRLLIFPEGTRSPAGALHPFYRGAARIALASECDVVPVVIDCKPPFGLKGRPWYDIPEVTPIMSISVGKTVKAREYIDGGESTGVAARKVNRAWRQYFLSELNYVDD